MKKGPKILLDLGPLGTYLSLDSPPGSRDLTVKGCK